MRIIEISVAAATASFVCEVTEVIIFLDGS